MFIAYCARSVLIGTAFYRFAAKLLTKKSDDCETPEHVPMTNLSTAKPSAPPPTTTAATMVVTVDERGQNPQVATVPRVTADEIASELARRAPLTKVTTSITDTAAPTTAATTKAVTRKTQVTFC